MSNSHVVGLGSSLSKVRLKTNTNRDLFVAVSRTNISISNIGFSADPQNDNTKTNSLKFDRCINVKLSDLEISNTKTGIFILGAGSSGCKNISIERVYFPRVYDFAVRAKDNVQFNISIEKCVVDSVLNNIAGGETSAFRIMGRNMRVGNSTINYSYDTGIMISGIENDGVVVENNFIRSRNVGVFVGTGAKRVIVHGNDISSTNDHGIHAYNPGSSSIYSGNIFTANEIHDCAKTGLYIEGMSGVTASGNIIARVGTRTDVSTRERTGITLISNTSSLNSGKITLNGNVIYDDQSTPSTQRGISIETVALDNLEVVANSITNVADANKVYFSAPVSEKNIHSIALNVQTAKGAFTSRGLSAGEITNSNRPLASSLPGNTLFFNRETKLYEYSDGATWTPLISAVGFISQAGNDTVQGQKTFSKMGNFWGEDSPQIRLSFDAGNYTNLFTNTSGNLIISPSGGNVSISSNLATGTLNGNLYVTNYTGIGTSITAGGYLFGSASSIQTRIGLRGTSNATITSNNSYAGFIVGSQPVTASSIGTHKYIVGSVFKAPLITAGGASISSAATVLIDDEPVAGLTNYGLVNRAKSRLVGPVFAESTISAQQYRLTGLNTKPTSSTDTGTVGEIRVTSEYIYVCIGTNQWVRAALASW